MEKETLIMIPGWSSNEILWEYQTQALSDCINPEVIVMDAEPDRDTMVAKVLRQAPKRFVLAGQSMGGWAAQKIAATAPERVSKLFLVNTWSSSDPKFAAIKNQVLEALKAGMFDEVIASHAHLVLHPDRLQNSTMMGKLKEEMLSLNLDILCQQLEAMSKDYSSLHLLEKIQAPTLVIAGRQDKLFGLDEQRLITRTLPHGQLAIIEECGHVSPMEQPQAVTALMRFFLENG